MGVEIGDFDKHVLCFDSDVKFWTILLEVYPDQAGGGIIIDLLQSAPVHIRNYHQFLRRAAEQSSHGHGGLYSHLALGIGDMHALHVLYHIP